MATRTSRRREKRKYEDNPRIDEIVGSGKDQDGFEKRHINETIGKFCFSFHKELLLLQEYYDYY